jgi:hypothetical protein
MNGKENMLQGLTAVRRSQAGTIIWMHPKLQDKPKLPEYVDAFFPRSVTVKGKTLLDMNR